MAIHRNIGREIVRQFKPLLLPLLLLVSLAIIFVGVMVVESNVATAVGVAFLLVRHHYAKMAGNPAWLN